jgi:hypothetical protein
VATNIHWCLPGLRSHVAITLPPSLGADHLGCHSQYKRKEWKGMKGCNQTTVQRTHLYEPIRPTTDRYSSMLTFRRIQRTGKLHLHWQVVKTDADAIYTGPRSNKQVKRWREQKQREANKGTILHTATSKLIHHLPSITVARISRRWSSSESSGP